jgi:hypothetical protein
MDDYYLSLVKESPIQSQFNQAKDKKETLLLAQNLIFQSLDMCLSDLPNGEMAKCA